MTPLIDADVLLHEIGWSCQFKDKDTGEEILFEFDRAAEMLDEKIRLICQDVGASEPPILYLSDSEWLSRYLDREYIRGFRYSVAKAKPYKGTRHNPKPFHFYNILAYMLANYDTHISSEGYEADDEMCMTQTINPNTVICSRDKDLRICPGWHFSWECGKQKAIDLTETDEIGWLSIKDNEDVLGYGLKFFYYQMLVGDTADNIPGLPGVGKAGALKALQNLTTWRELHDTEKTMYRDVMGEQAKDYFFEQANLLWMVQRRGETFSMKMKELK